MQDFEPEVVVVGSGAGGGAVAWTLANAGVKVVILESGPEFLPQYDYPLSTDDWELRDFPDQPDHPRYTFAELQNLDPKLEHLLSRSLRHGLANTGSKRLAGQYMHVRGVGGSTLHYSGEAHRLHPDAMNMYSRHGVAADWPISYAELEPYYVKAEKLIGVAGPDNQGARWRSEPFPLPPHALSYASRAVTRDSTFNWQANSLGILSRAYRNRPPCNYCANCNRGCPRGDKGSVDVTFIRSALATGNCRIETFNTVTEIHAGKNDEVRSVTVRNTAGLTHEISARVFVAACGALETPRLLLLSSIANESGQVGKNFMETVLWQLSGLHKENLGSHRGLPVDTVCWDFNAPHSIPGAPGGCTLTVATPQSYLVGPVAYAHRVVDGWGRQHKQAMREQFGRAITIQSGGAFLPNDSSYIDLDPEEKDLFGQPLPRINSYVDDTTTKRLTFMQGLCRQVSDEAGIDTIVEEIGTYDQFVASHVFGTCRMGDSPEDSVVDRWGRSHRWKNLFIADASVFPSSGGGEAPSLTIQALAIRTGEHIRDQLARRAI